MKIKIGSEIQYYIPSNILYIVNKNILYDRTIEVLKNDSLYDI